MKKLAFILAILLCACAVLSGCETGFGSKYVTDAKEYGAWESYLEIPAFLPETLTPYRVNAYAYTLHAYMDICSEIFLDITTTPEQLDEILTRARADAPTLFERDAYYAEGYTELVFEDVYEIFDGDPVGQEAVVGWADIEKIVYNPTDGNVVFVVFHANDTGVYPLDELQYFNRFSIQQQEYTLHLN